MGFTILIRSDINGMNRCTTLNKSRLSGTIHFSHLFLIIFFIPTLINAYDQAKRVDYVGGSCLILSCYEVILTTAATPSHPQLSIQNSLAGSHIFSPWIVATTFLACFAARNSRYPTQS